LSTALAWEVMQLPLFIHPSVHPSDCLFISTLTFEPMTFDLDLLHVYGWSWL